MTDESKAYDQALAYSECAKRGDIEACGKQAMQKGLETACQAAATAYAGPAGSAAGSVACGPLAKLITDFAWPIAKNLLTGFGATIQSGVMAILPDDWAAQGTFDEWFYAYQHFAAVKAQWDSSIEAITEAWKVSRVQLALPDGSFSIRRSSLQLANDAINGGLDLSAIAAMPGISPAPIRPRSIDRWSNPLHVFSADCDPEQDVLNAITATIDVKVDARVALMIWLYAFDPLGWSKASSYNWDLASHGNAWTRNARPAGPIELASVDAPNAENGGKGPFGLAMYGWPDKCNEYCARANADGTRGCWAFRLGALARATHGVLAAVAIDGQRAVEESGVTGAGRVVRAAAVTAGVAGAGYGIWKGVEWLIKNRGR